MGPYPRMSSALSWTRRARSAVVMIVVSSPAMTSCKVARTIPSSSLWVRSASYSFGPSCCSSFVWTWAFRSANASCVDDTLFLR